MAYSVNKTNGDLLVTVNDGTSDTTSTDITLIGKNFRGYGEILNENFVKLLENFANTSEPESPIAGQIWYDTDNEQIKVYDGTAFVVVGPADSTTPVTASTITASDILYVGSGAEEFETDAGLTDVIAVMHKEANGFVQSALHNPSNDAEASTDFIVYCDIGDNDSGWMDMGITSSGFEAAEFGITSAGDGYIFMSAPDGAGLGGNLVICTDSTGTQNDIIFATNGFTSTTEQGRFVSGEGFRVQGNLVSVNGSVYQGPNAKSLILDDYNWTGYVGLTNATAVFTGDANDFVQFAIKNENNGTSASTDLIAYASDGDNDSGWVNLGITSENFSDPEFTVTGPGTGYLFFSAPATTSGTGDLLVGTDETGSQNDIVFFTGGFDAGNERMRIVGTDRVSKSAGVEIYLSTASTSTSTGALRVQGGIGLLGNLNVGGNVNIVGNITLGGEGNTVETETLAVTNPVIFMGTGNPANLYDLGFAGEYNIASTELYTGLIKDVTDGHWKLFSNVAVPGDTTDFTGATYDTLYLGNIIAVGNQASSSTTTGTVVVTGGVGVSGNVYVGGTVYGESTSAQYADLAEKYLADQEYPVGTVVAIGGEKEVTACQIGDRAIGTVSESPAFMMNRDLEGGTYIALKGRVPVRVQGEVRKGDRLVAGENGHAVRATIEQYADVFAVALGQTVQGPSSQIIEALVL